MPRAGGVGCPGGPGPPAASITTLSPGPWQPSLSLGVDAGPRALSLLVSHWHEGCLSHHDFWASSHFRASVPPA